MTYFKPLRRKLGVFTLLMACILTVGWMRSRNGFDELHIRGDDGKHYFLHSSSRGIGLSYASPHSHADKFGKVSFETRADSTVFERGLEAAGVSWSSAWFGFRHGEVVKIGINMQIWQASYLSLVFPLTLLSTWLLISAPPQKNSRGKPPAKED